MRRTIPVYRFMTPDPHTIGRDQPLSVAHGMMRRHEVRHLPVLDGERLVGIVSERDLRLVESLRDVDVDRTRVEDAMTPDPYVVSADAPVLEVALRMARDKHGSAIVTSGGGVIGVFTATDGLRALAYLLDDASVPPAGAPRAS